MQAFVKSFARKMVYVVAAVILIIATLVIIAHLLTPVLDKRRPEIERWASNLLTMPVTINNVSVSWYGYQPGVTLNKVIALNKTTNKPALEVKKIRVFFSIPKSLWQMKLIPSTILISGTSVVVQQTANGEFVLQDFPTFNTSDKPLDSETKFNDVMNWLSNQPRLILRDIDVHYTGYAAQKRFITLYDLSFENSGTTHTILGKAILHQEVPTKADVVVQWTGAEFDMTKIHARLYLYVSGLSLSQWWKDVTWQGWQLNNGVASARIWATWHKNSFRKIQTTLQIYGLDLNSLTTKATHRITRISGNFGWRREGDTQIFAGDDILIDLPAHLWPVTNFYAQLIPDSKGTLFPKSISLGYVDIGDVQSFLFSSPPVLPDNVLKKLRALKLKGNLQNAALTFNGAWTEWEKIALNAKFNQISFESSEKIPGVTNLSGSMQWLGGAGNILLNSNRLIVEYDPLFAAPLKIDQLTGELHVNKDANKAWHLQITSLQVLNNDAAANVSGSYTIPETGTPTADISANLTMQRVTHITRYLPVKMMDKDLNEWLQQAFLGGEVKSANVVLRGPITDFPFDKNNGTFLVTSELKNVDLRYAPDWPVLKHIEATLKFSGREMTVDASHAQILTIPINGLQVVIPYLGNEKPAIVTVKNTTIKTDFAQGINFIQNSPLQKNLGKLFVGAEGHGPITLNLGLTIPLNNVDKTEVRGSLSLTDAELNLVPWHLNINHLNGQIAFTDSTAAAQDIKGLLFNKPFTLNLTTIKKTGIDIIEASFDSNLSMYDLEDWLKVPFSKVVQGATNVAGKIDFSWQTPMQIHLQSNLNGVSVDLNAPYGKKAEEERNFTADIEMPDNQPLRMKLSYGDLLSAALIMERKQEKFTLLSANLKLGGGEVSWPAGNGLYITGEFDRLDWDKIKMYLDQVQGGSSSMNNLPLPLRSININAKKLNLFGQNLESVSLKVEPAGKNWNVMIDSPSISGQLQVPVNFSRQGVMTAQFEKLALHAVANDGGKMPVIDVKSLPAINFSASNVRYNDMLLGQINFKTSPSSSGMDIHNLHIFNPTMEVHADGEWTQSGGTHLQGTATSGDVSALLNNFGFDAHNFIASKGTLNFDLSWHDAPYAPTVASLNGDAQMDLGKGRVVEVGSGNDAQMGLGRMLSIFSLQSIPRRLSGDFSDLFQQGYSFDFVRGDFTFKNGNAFTNNMHIEGPMAKVMINGRIGLKNKDYNFVLSVTPYVTSSLPLAAAWIGGPVTGLAALAVNTVIGSQVSKMIATYEYLVTGPWDNPSWQPLNSASKKPE